MELKPKIKKRQITFKVSEETRESLRLISDIEGIPMTVIIEQLIQRQIEEGGYGQNT